MGLQCEAWEPSGGSEKYVPKPAVAAGVTPAACPTGPDSPVTVAWDQPRTL